jgi:hypothetical protein
MEEIDGLRNGLLLASTARAIASWQPFPRVPFVREAGIARSQRDGQDRAMPLGGSHVSLPSATAVRRHASGRRKRSILFGLLMAAALLPAFSEGSAMGLFTRLVLFSPVHGVVLKNGVPVENAVVRQEVSFFDEKIPPQRVSSDASGKFSFPAVERNAGLSRLVPHQPVIMQTILITHDGVEYEAWMHTKNSYEENSELDGRPLNLECDLVREPNYEGTHYGICKAV